MRPDIQLFFTRFVTGAAFFIAFSVYSVSAKASENYVFERMWPEIRQPWYFYLPKGVAVDRLGNVYVADTSNHRIQKFDSDGVFIAKWEVGGASVDQFDRPCGITIGNDGHVFVADYENDRIKKFESDGVFITEWGGYGTGDGQFYFPHGRYDGPKRQCVFS